MLTCQGKSHAHAEFITGRIPLTLFIYSLGFTIPRRWKLSVDSCSLWTRSWKCCRLGWVEASTIVSAPVSVHRALTWTAELSVLLPRPGEKHGQDAQDGQSFPVCAHARQLRNPARTRNTALDRANGVVIVGGMCVCLIGVLLHL